MCHLVKIQRDCRFTGGRGKLRRQSLQAVPQRIGRDIVGSQRRDRMSRVGRQAFATCRASNSSSCKRGSPRASNSVSSFQLYRKEGQRMALGGMYLTCNPIALTDRRHLLRLSAILLKLGVSYG